MSRDNKNDEAWLKLFNKHHILDRIDSDGQYIITADQIKEFREPRLMTKFDNRSQLPLLFQKHKLSILPLTRGSYSISNYSVYHRFEEIESPIIEVSYPDYIQSINWEDITSESTAINVAYISNMLSHFLNDEGLLPTVNGRMGSKEFNYYINNKKLKCDQAICVKNSQIEIDGGFEGLRSLSLIEAKNVLSEDFLVRQLYYPYRLWNTQVTKQVRPVYLTYSNNVFTLYEYAFEDINHYNSLKLINSSRYALKQEPITLDDIMNIYLRSSHVFEDPQIPFIQANSFYRIINLCELLYERTSMSSKEIAEEFGFAERQSDYYYNAGRYIGLFEKVRDEEGIKVILSTVGRSLMKMTVKERNLKLTSRILEHRVMHEIFGFYLYYQEFPDINHLVSIMKKHNVNIESDSLDMYFRRASSITGWIKWIFSLIRS